jgi:hypothetical protein
VSYSDDSLTPAAPFSGDDTGQFGETPDIVRESPTTNERVVDTQSGFLVIVRRMNNRIALSVKRRIGTPPTSGIYLTPDESLKLSGILADQVSGQSGSATNARKIESSVKGWLGTLGSSSTAEARLNPGTNEIEMVDDAENVDGGDIDERAFHREARARRASRNGANQATRLALILCGLILVATLSGGAYSLFAHKRTVPVVAVPAAQELSPLSDAFVDKFARAFISDMLDFDPDTYKVSQIQAMSHMTAPVLEKYWQETNFPLAKKQLKSLPQGQTVMITKVAQERTGPEKKEVDVFAELVSANSKISTPVHLKLGLSVSQEKDLKVESLQDLTSKK